MWRFPGALWTKRSLHPSTSHFECTNNRMGDVYVHIERHFEWFRVSVFPSTMGRSPSVAPKANIREFNKIIRITLDIKPNQNFK